MFDRIFFKFILFLRFKLKLTIEFDVFTIALNDFGVFVCFFLGSGVDMKDSGKKNATKNVKSKNKFRWKWIINVWNGF